MDDERALWEVATALGSEFDADATRTRAHAAAALLDLVGRVGEPSPLDREWREGMAASTVAATVRLLVSGQLDGYLATGEHAGGAAEAIAKLAPLPEPKDLVFANVMLDKLYTRRHPG